MKLHPVHNVHPFLLDAFHQYNIVFTDPKYTYAVLTDLIQVQLPEPRRGAQRIEDRLPCRVEVAIVEVDVQQRLLMVCKEGVERGFSEPESRELKFLEVPVPSFRNLGQPQGFWCS